MRGRARADYHVAVMRWVEEMPRFQRRQGADFVLLESHPGVPPAACLGPQSCFRIVSLLSHAGPLAACPPSAGSGTQEPCCPYSIPAAGAV